MGTVSAETSGSLAYPARVDSPVSRVSAAHPSPAWRPKQSSLWPPVPPNPAPDRPAGLATSGPEESQLHKPNRLSEPGSHTGESWESHRACMGDSRGILLGHSTLGRAS